MRILKTGEPGFEAYLAELERRGGHEDLRLERKVRSILNDVSRRGDDALLHYTRALDGVKISVEQLQVKKWEIANAYQKVPAKFARTLGKAARRIRTFHERMGKRLIGSWEVKERGIRLVQRVKPLERVGIYVPGGKASYPSTVLMAGIPAKVAGVQEVFMVTPPQPEGGISPAVLVAASLIGIDRIYRVGGVQAIGALTFGTPSIPRVDKIVGPGNRYVATAKRLVFGLVDIDMVAGPSEIVILSDEKAPASWVAADLISQAEHDEMALAVLITPSERMAIQVAAEIKKQLFSLRRRKIAEASLKRRGAILIVRDVKQAITMANRIAPEHLELCLSHPRAFVKEIKHAGAVFLGCHTPEAIGDYLAGPNHILPTAGTARFSSPLGVEDFLKRVNLLEFDGPALGRFEKDVKQFAEWEGLEGHYQAVRVRKE